MGQCDGVVQRIRRVASIKRAAGGNSLADAPFVGASECRRRRLAHRQICTHALLNRLAGGENRPGGVGRQGGGVGVCSAGTNRVARERVRI